MSANDERREVVAVAQGKSDNVTVVTLACGHRQVWESRTRLPEVGSTLWCSSCYSYGASPANTKALRRVAQEALKSPSPEAAT